ncbi:MAG TPA: DUF4190 domain-containing protein [Polyangia bacterium]|nr:DUF4190 domain-containing protein [Polyangia bacterium]
MAVAALVLGIVGTLFSLNWLTVWVGGPAAIVAIVLGILARKQNVAAGRPTGMATAGLVLGIVGTTIAVLIFAVCASCAAAVGAAGRQASKEIEKAAQEAKVQQEAEAKKTLEEPAAGEPAPAEGTTAPAQGAPSRAPAHAPPARK